MNEPINLPFIGRDLKTDEEKVIGVVHSIEGDVFNIKIWNKDDLLWAEYDEEGNMVTVGIDIIF